MTISDVSVLSMLKEKLSWHQNRQRVLAENVANADMPGFVPQDLTPMQPDRRRPMVAPVRLAITDASHIVGSAASKSAQPSEDFTDWETTPAGNSVVLEEQMMKVTQNQMDFQTATTLYARGIAMLRGAVRSA